MRTFFVVSILLAAAHHAEANCTADMDGIQRSNVADISSYAPCQHCRSAQDFAKDFLAQASNFVFHTDQGLSALGTSAGTLGNGALIFPVCSEDHGQCMTASVTMQMNFVEIPFLGEIRAVPLGVRSYTIRVTDAGGNSIQTTAGPVDPPYSADAPPEYLIPGDDKPDTIPDGQCRTNTGHERPGNSSGGGGSDGPGDGGGGSTVVGGGAGPWPTDPYCWSEDRGYEVVRVCYIGR